MKTTIKAVLVTSITIVLGFLYPIFDKWYTQTYDITGWDTIVPVIATVIVFAILIIISIILWIDALQGKK